MAVEVVPLQAAASVRPGMQMRQMKKEDSAQTMEEECRWRWRWEGVSFLASLALFEEVEEE